jgi:hypothetical protein
MSKWNPKHPGSEEYYSLDIKKQLAQGDRIESCAAEIEAMKPEDPEATDMLIGGPEVSGTEIAQKVRGGLQGCRYKITFTITTLHGETLKASGNFHVEGEAPGNRDLTSLQAVKDWLGLDNAASDSLLQRLITAESRAIENYLQRPILAETRTDFAHGYGGATIMLPANPIQSIEKALIDGAEVKVRHDNLVAWRADGLNWPRNCRVQVTYIAGFGSVPSDIEQACVELVGMRYKEKDRIGHASKALAGETVSFITRAMPHSVEAKLAPYKKVVPC